MTNNPLQKYYRQPKMFIELPSGTHYYTPEQVVFTDNEIGILPMTAADELLFKNPDALLNGQAITNVIKSCVPDIKDVPALLNNDIEVMLIAIRHATYGDNIDIDTECPKCKAHNEFTLNVSQTMSSTGKLEDEYFVDLKADLRVYVQPFKYTNILKALKIQFKQQQAAEELVSSMPAEQKYKLFSKNFNEITTLNFDLLVDSIVKVTVGDEVVTNKTHIKEFLGNIDKAAYTAIDNQISEINQIGVKKNFDAQCTKCEHEWEAEINFNPVNFSLAF